MVKNIILCVALILFGFMILVVPIVSLYYPTLKNFISNNEYLWNYITSISTAAVVLGLILAYWQLHLSNQVATFEFIEEIDDEFYSKRLITERKKTCSKPVEEIEVDHTLDFFEKIAYLEKRGIIDLDSIYELWEYWVGHYWVMHKKDIYAFRKEHNDDTYYNQLETLVKKLAKIFPMTIEEYERKNEEDLEDFKKEERELEIDC